MTTMRKKIMFSAVTFMALAAAAPAFADDKGGAGHQKLQFPVPAATFKQHVDAKQAKIKEHMEKKIAAMPPSEQKDARAKMDAKFAAMNAEVAKAIADGTVTKEEADKVRAAGGGHGGHCDGKKGDKK
jgi:hypothetical protein